MAATMFTYPLVDYDLIWAAIRATDAALAAEFGDAWRGLFSSGRRLDQELSVPNEDTSNPFLGGVVDIDDLEPPFKAFDRTATPFRTPLGAVFWRQQAADLQNADRRLRLADQILKTNLVTSETETLQFDVSIPPAITEMDDGVLRGKSLITVKSVS